MYFWTSVSAIASIVLFGLITREMPRIHAKVLCRYPLAFGGTKSGGSAAPSPKK